ncbi:hypothetical protein [Novosphingobium sp. Fuku2-ISO-50]|uniref:type IV toxin-antitoxin system AbiEi family antitoxin domain-containing protein n=1 Tax=Novosphingobium sp. Fuku2-ISO-50 TaxID=1739114 RepID=UPI00076D66C7|nr:hypothetical protein [Novosphingobium sp. Fuku2-ISO-50]KUR81369.1 hypothetical protein AQZ50_01200 [Novosphingobium sp. Fuku2-ISO-50]MDR3486624.1 hypothetical protein [Bradyrhizobium sp.]
MNFTDGLENALLERDAPIVTDYEFFVLGQQLFAKKEWKGEPLKRLPLEWDRTRARNAINRLGARRTIAPDVDFRSGVWRVVQSTRAGSAEEIACIADPFCYVSHLSAMQRYGLTDRSPEALHLTTPIRSIWNGLRDRKLQADLGEQLPTEHPALVRLGFKGVVRRRPVIVHESSHPAQPIPVAGERTQIASIGRTFVDMLAEPALCGGIHHVLDIWNHEAEQWAPQIIQAVDCFEAKIVKVRAGYILTEVLEIEDDRINAWQQYAQRGGSRKLNPDAPYGPTYSERWMISLNV